ncbi:MAG: hypothetical protein ACLGH6_05205 [Gammaproteobacteria bacterium]
MTTRWIHPALGALVFAGIAGSAHAAWGHSDYAHIQAYQHLEAFAAPRTAATGRTSSGMLLNEPVTIRAFDEDFAEINKQTRKARRSDRAAGPARS